MMTAERCYRSRITRNLAINEMDGGTTAEIV